MLNLALQKKKSESNVKMLFADSYCDIPSILIPPSCLQVFVGEEGNSKQKDMTRTTGRCGKSIFTHFGSTNQLCIVLRNVSPPMVENAWLKSRII